VIRLGLRLAVSGGREAVIRLAVLAVAVGLGVGLLLTALSAINAVNAQNDRHAWLWTGSDQEPAGHAPAGTAPLWWSTSGDEFGSQQVVRVDVAATGPTSPVPPGIPRDPAPGQYYASPALASLLRSTPAGELAGRYPGRLAGTIGHAALPSPDSLFIIIGHTAAQLARTPDTIAVTTIATALPIRFGGRNPKGLATPPPDEGVGAGGVDLIFSVVALALLLPVLIFIATATRLSAARREQRFAAMRLVGARPRQISVIAAVESTLAAAAGVAAGFGLFFVLRIPLAAVPFTGEPFFPSDLSLSLPDILAVAIGVPVAAALVARLALRRVQISPLGVTRRATPKPPRAWRVLPLLAGLAELAFFVVHGRPATAAGQTQAYVPGFLLIMIGLIVAGPWLTMTGADHGPPHQPPQRADRRPPAGRRPAGRVPRGQRTGPGPVHHHRGRGGYHHAGRQGRPPDRLGLGRQRPVGRPRRPAAAHQRSADHRRPSVADSPGVNADAGPAAGPAEQDPRRRERDHGSRVRQVDPPQSGAWRKRPWVPLGISGDRPRSRRPGLVLPAGPRFRPRPLPSRGGSRVIPKVPGRRPARQEPRKDHLAGRRCPR
jgi:hypothetical protein